MLVLHADCDLDQDYAQRNPGDGKPTVQADARKLIPEILLCDVFEAVEIRGRVAGSDIFKRVHQNQDERFHRFPAAEIGNTGTSMPELFLDFKRTYMENTPSLYEGLMLGSIQKFAMIPPVYIHDLMHRFFGFHSRVGLPD